MNKRTFIKSMLLLSLASDRLKSFLPTSPHNLPKKWVWLRPNVDKNLDYWKNQFDQYRAAGIEAILPEVYNSFNALFDHPTFPVKDRWLERVLPIAKSAGLQVHAWMWSMPLNHEKYVNNHPDWFSVNRLGQPSHTHPAYVDYYKFLDPCHPEVKEFVAGNVRALANISELDGIHLDYIRQPDVILAEGLWAKYDIIQDKEYPQYDYPYSRYCREAFKQETGIDPMDLGDDAPHHQAWRQFRYDAMTQLVNDYLVPEAKKRNKVISAAVFPNWESVRQQWHRWDLDAFLPMLYQGFYLKDAGWIADQVEKALSLMPSPKPVFAGLFTDHLKPSELQQVFKECQEKGASGISLFDAGGLNDQWYRALKSISH